MINNLKCVVLNTTHEPLNIISTKKGWRLCAQGKAVVHKTHDFIIKTVKESHPAPAVIVLRKYVHVKVRTAMLTRRNLFERDNFTCQYCLRHKNALRDSEFLTRDHIVPESKGGKSTWMNLVTCCNTCNNKKGNRTAQESGMILHSKQFVPSVAQIWKQRFNL